MANINNRQLNFTVLYGVILKKKKNSLYIDYGNGKIKVITKGIEGFESLEKNYTISLSGYLKQGLIRTTLIAQQISIFDKSPHFIKLED